MLNSPKQINEHLISYIKFVCSCFHVKWARPASRIGICVINIETELRQRQSCSWECILKLYID